MATLGLATLGAGVAEGRVADAAAALATACAGVHAVVKAATTATAAIADADRPNECFISILLSQ